MNKKSLTTLILAVLLLALSFTALAAGTVDEGELRREAAQAVLEDVVGSVSIPPSDERYDKLDVYEDSGLTTKDAVILLRGVASEFTFEVRMDGTEEKAAVTKYNGAKTDVTIPATYTVGLHTYPVTVIGADAFKDNTTIVSVSFPSTIKKIEARAFSGCTALKSSTMQAAQG